MDLDLITKAILGIGTILGGLAALDQLYRKLRKWRRRKRQIAPDTHTQVEGHLGERIAIVVMAILVLFAGWGFYSAIFNPYDRQAENEWTGKVTQEYRVRTLRVKDGEMITITHNAGDNTIAGRLDGTGESFWVTRSWKGRIKVGGTLLLWVDKAKSGEYEVTVKRVAYDPEAEDEWTGKVTEERSVRTLRVKDGEMITITHNAVDNTIAGKLDTASTAFWVTPIWKGRIKVGGTLLLWVDKAKSGEYEVTVRRTP